MWLLMDTLAAAVPRVPLLAPSRRPTIPTDTASLHTEQPLFTCITPNPNKTTKQTVANFRQDACLYIIPSLLGLGLLSTAYASALAWRKGARRLRSPSQSLIGSNGGAASAAAPPPSSTGLQTLQPRGSGRRAN